MNEKIGKDMKKIILATKRRWNWKVFLVLAGLIIPAAFAILPYSIHLQNATSQQGFTSKSVWEITLINTLLNSLLIVILGGIGLALANRIGLGMPFVERWIKRETVPSRFRNGVAIAWITAVAFVLLILFLQTVVFGPPMKAMFDELGIELPAEVSPPALYGFLAAISAGITEETLFRLFGLSLLAWLGGLLFHDPEGRPKPVVLWTANVLFALAFGAAHLQTAAAIGWPINALVITRTIALNGLGGLAFGWLFWTFGLESAMLAHFFADVILHALIPFTATLQDVTGRILAIAGVVVVILLIFLWAWRTLITESRRRHIQTAD
jgi:hypothetical protein